MNTKSIDLLNHLICDWIGIKTNTTNRYKSLINSFLSLVDNAKEKNKNVSCDFNVLRFFHPIGETMHSFLLAKLLDPNSEHGQNNLFLKLFLQKLNIDKPDTENWIVTAEKSRVDVLLKRFSPHSVIVIENKSNNAVDQPNQLYRCWYYQIYLKNTKIDYTKKENFKNFKVIYLIPNDWKQPSDNSLTRPSYLPNDLPDEIPIKPKIWKFNKEIVEWLEQSLEQLPEKNYRMQEYVKQYIEYWS